jgi:hypothetical protein
LRAAGPQPTRFLRHSDTHLARDETPQEHSRRVHKPTSLLLAKDKSAQWQQGMHSQTQARPSGPRAQPATTSTLMARGFRAREGVGLCCSFHNVPGTASPAWTCSMQHGGRGGCRFATAETYMPISRCRPPPPIRGATHLTMSLGLTPARSPWACTDPPQSRSISCAAYCNRPCYTVCAATQPEEAAAETLPALAAYLPAAPATSLPAPPALVPEGHIVL